MNRDLEHLKLLEIFHYIRGALACFFGLFGLIYVVIGVAVVLLPTKSSEAAPPLLFGGLFFVIGLFWFGISEISGILSLIAGWRYRKQKGYYFCFIVAILECLTGLTGIALGVFSLIVLNRPSVKALLQGRTGNSIVPMPPG